MYLLFGLGIGFIACIPLGPVNVFVISQAMKRDFFHGLMAGLTAAFLDFIYCLVAILGLSQVTALMNRWAVLLKIVAAIFLLLIAIRIYHQSKEYKESIPAKQTGSFSPRPILAVLALYISNPALYLFWTVQAAWVTSHGWVDDTILVSVTFALACGTGGALWYLILTRYVSKYHHQFSAKTIRTIFLVLAIILFVMAIYSFLNVFIDFKKLLDIKKLL
jgi:L-lysine exporter family protein LysE/ArgO